MILAVSTQPLDNLQCFSATGEARVWGRRPGGRWDNNTLGHLHYLQGFATGEAGNATTLKDPTEG